MIGALVTALLALAGFAVWSVRLGRVARLARAQDAPLARTPKIAVVVPARNEAENLPALLGSLRALEPPATQVVVVDDHSSDGTGGIARAAGAQVVTPRALPAGWIGKPWACARGVEALDPDAELVLFTDADTVHAHDSLARTSARLVASGADLVSVVPSHVAVRFWEKLQGAFQLLLLVATSAGKAGKGERQFAIGQYLLFRRQAYDRLGGHARVRGRVAEDLLFARAVGDQGGKVAVVVAPGLLQVRMYPEGLGAFLRGWRRNFREGLRSAGALAGVELALIYAWLWGLPLAALTASTWSEALVWGGASLLSLVEVARRQRLVGRLPWWGTLGAPLMLAAFAWCSLLAVWDLARRAPVVWRGRVIPQEELR